jgi:hypothetical protein
MADYGLVEKKRGLKMYVGEGAREQLVEDDRRVFIDSELPEFQNCAQWRGFIHKDLLREMS